MALGRVARREAPVAQGVEVSGSGTSAEWAWRKSELTLGRFNALATTAGVDCLRWAGGGNVHPACVAVYRNHWGATVHDPTRKTNLCLGDFGCVSVDSIVVRIDMESCFAWRRRTDLGDRYVAGAKVRFPRGFIRTAWHFQSELEFISNDTLRSNLSYLWLEIEVYRWILLRTDLYGAAREMVIKRVICLIGNAVESTMRGYYGRHIGKHKKYRKVVEQLLDDQIIEAELADELFWIWEVRTTEHVFLNKRLELNIYTSTDLTRARKASQTLVALLAHAPF